MPFVCAGNRLGNRLTAHCPLPTAQCPMPNAESAHSENTKREGKRGTHSECGGGRRPYGRDLDDCNTSVSRVFRVFVQIATDDAHDGGGWEEVATHRRASCSRG